MTEQENGTPIAVEVGGGRLWVELEDGRVIGTPLEWYMPLANATPEQLANYELLDDTIHWPDLDEDLSIAAMVAGVRPRYPWSVDEWRARLNSLRALNERYGMDATMLLPIHMTDPLDASVTVREIAQDYGLSTDAVYQAIRRKRLPAQRSGATWLIRRRDAEAVWGPAHSTMSSDDYDVTVGKHDVRSIQDVDDIARRRYEILGRLFAASAFAISGAAFQGEQLQITTRKKADIILKQGDTLIAIDVKEWTPKGMFQVSGEGQGEYYAIAIGAVDPMLKGYVYQEGEVSMFPDMAAVHVAGAQI